MRVLNFTAENEESFKVIYEGLCLTSKQFTPKEQRGLNRLFDAFEKVGKGIAEKNAYNFQELAKLPAEIILEEADYDLLKSALESVQWNGFGARKAGKALIFLDECPSAETKPALVKEEK